MTKINNKVCGKHRWADKMEGQVSKQKTSEGNKNAKNFWKNGVSIGGKC